MSQRRWGNERCRKFLKRNDIYERWIRKFERRRLGALHDLKKKLEGDTDGSD